MNLTDLFAPLSAMATSQFIAEGSHVQVWRKVDDPALIAAMTADRRWVCESFAFAR